MAELLSEDVDFEEGGFTAEDLAGLLDPVAGPVTPMGLPLGASFVRPLAEPGEEEAPKPETKVRRWYDILEALVPFSDLVIIAGFAIVVAGIAMIHRPAAVVLAGLGILKVGWWMAHQG